MTPAQEAPSNARTGPSRTLNWGDDESETVIPDVGVFGPYTYLVTEIAWGAIALVLLTFGSALRTAARTIAVLYPFAYVWDWYSLRVGIFSIELRTGHELLGIPIEEHLFMIVVPAVVVGTHETLRTVLDDGGPGPSDRTNSGEPDREASDHEPKGPRI